MYISYVTTDKNCSCLTYQNINKLGSPWGNWSAIVNGLLQYLIHLAPFSLFVHHTCCKIENEFNHAPHTVLFYLIKNFKKTHWGREKRPSFPDDIFKCIFFNENVWILIKISLKFVPGCPINDILALVQIMAWRRSGDIPLSDPMMVRLPTHICVTRPQWVKDLCFDNEENKIIAGTYVKQLDVYIDGHLYFDEYISHICMKAAWELLYFTINCQASKQKNKRDCIQQFYCNKIKILSLSISYIYWQLHTKNEHIRERGLGTRYDIEWLPACLYLCAIAMTHKSVGKSGLT